MRWCIEVTDGDVFEVTNLFDKRGNNTDELDFAESIVIKFSEENYQATAIYGAVHRIQ